MDSSNLDNGIDFKMKKNQMQVMKKFAAVHIKQLNDNKSFLKMFLFIVFTVILILLKFKNVCFCLFSAAVYIIEPKPSQIISFVNLSNNDNYNTTLMSRCRCQFFLIFSTFFFSNFFTFAFGMGWVEAARTLPSNSHQE